MNPNDETERSRNQHLRHIHLPVAYFHSSDHATEPAVGIDLPGGGVMHVTAQGRTVYDTGGQVKEYALRLGLSIGDMVRAFEQISEAFGPMRDALTDASVLQDPGPSEPMARALWLKQHRNTGPERPSGASAHRPRRHR